MISTIYGCAILALIAAFVYSRKVMAVSVENSGATPEITARFKEISGAIGEGAT